MKQAKHILALLLCLTLVLGAVSGCGGKGGETAPAESAAPEESAAPAEPTPAPEETDTTEETAAPERADGEEFEATILIEGMEETVNYRHVVNQTAGFAMDYEFESFVRQSDPDRERFVWGYDDPQNPENYLEVYSSPEDAETVAARITESLSADYSVSRDTIALDKAGECIRLDASATPDGTHTADVLQAVYIIPAADGCRIAALRYLPEGSDGFGKRLSLMVNTIQVLDSQGE